jgi:uncharacterized protein (DUF58 family)
MAAGGVAVLGLFAFVWPPILALAGAALLPIGLLAWWDSRSAKSAIQKLVVKRTLQGVVGRDLPFQSILTISNAGSTAISGEVRDVLPSACVPQWIITKFELAASGVSTSSSSKAIECRIPIRGQHRFGPVWIRVQGPWALAEVQREIECFGEVKVLPETFASSGELQKDVGATLLLLDKVSRSRQVGAGTEFVSLFPYRLGDDPRRIDWRATARQGVPIVRRYQVERHRDVLILIDSGRLMGTTADRGSKLDCAIDAALNLARVALHSGDRCGIGVFDRTLRGYLAPITGPKSLGRLVESVYDLQTDWAETDFTQLFAELKRRQSKRCLLVILSDLGDAETSRMHCAAIARLNRQHLVLFAALQTPLLHQVLARGPLSIQEGAGQAVALGLLRDRSRAIHALKHGGIHVIDTLPERLTVPLINQFIELRQRNLL